MAIIEMGWTSPFHRTYLKARRQFNNYVSIDPNVGFLILLRSDHFMLLKRLGCLTLT